MRSEADKDNILIYLTKTKKSATVGSRGYND